MRLVPLRLLISRGEPDVALLIADRRSAQGEVTELARSDEMSAYFIHSLYYY